MLPRVLDAIGFRRGLLFGHSDGASIAAIYAGSLQDHRVRGLVLIAPHFFTEDMGVAEIARAKAAYRAQADLRDEARALARRRRQRVLQLVRGLARSRISQMGHHRGARLYPRADPDRAGRRTINTAPSAQIEAAQRGMLLPGRGRRSCRACGTRPHREAPERRSQVVVASSPTACCATTTKARLDQACVVHYNACMRSAVIECA